MKIFSKTKHYFFLLFSVILILFFLIGLTLVFVFVLRFAEFNSFETFTSSIYKFSNWFKYWYFYYYYYFTLSFKLFIYNQWGWPNFIQNNSSTTLLFGSYYLTELWNYFSTLVFNFWIFWIKPNYLIMFDYFTVYTTKFFHELKAFFSHYFPSIYYVVAYVYRYWNGITKSFQSVEQFIRLIKRKMRKAGWSWFYFYLGIFAALNFIFFALYLFTMFTLFLFFKPIIWYFSYKARLSEQYLHIISKRLTPEQLQMFYTTKSNFYFFRSFSSDRYKKFKSFFNNKLSYLLRGKNKV